jgi:exodeoxyribonuclease V gamma subunit
MNDGEFPRQRPPYGFDLLAQSPRRKGDRSRRDEDRCLFLEALVSARDALYLSYQGNDAKNNTEKQPSLVLAELSHYLQKGYWRPSKENQVMLSGVLRKLPLQPFNEKNYQPPFSGYDGKWLTLGQDAKQVSDTSTETMLPDISNSLNEAIDIADLVTFFNNPPKGFARKRLGLYLDDHSGALAADSEPFTTNNLDRYKTQSHYICHELKQARTPANVTIAATNDALETDEVTRLSLLAGHLPATPTMAIQLEEWREQALQFTAQLQEIGAGTVMDTRVQTTSGESVIHARLPLLTFTGTALATKTTTEGENPSNSVLLFWRLADIKGKDIVNLWLHHLMANITRGPTHTIGVFRAKGNQPSLQGFAPVQDAVSELQKWLHYWHKGLTQPCFVNADLAKEILTNEKFSASHYANYWQADFQQQGLIYDPYYAYFWQVPPVYDENLIGYAESLYGMAMSSLESWSAEEVKTILANIRVPQSDAINTADQRESHA